MHCESCILHFALLFLQAGGPRAQLQVPSNQPDTRRSIKMDTDPAALGLAACSSTNSRRCGASGRSRLWVSTNSLESQHTRYLGRYLPTRPINAYADVYANVHIVHVLDRFSPPLRCDRLQRPRHRHGVNNCHEDGPCQRERLHVGIRDVSFPFLPFFPSFFPFFPLLQLTNPPNPTPPSDIHEH